MALNPLSANFKKWSNTLKQVVGKLPMSCLSVFDHFVGLALKELIYSERIFLYEETISFLMYLDFCVFGESINFRICDVITGIAAH